MAEFKIGPVPTPHKTGAFSIRNQKSICKLYADPLCTKEISRGSYHNPITILVNASKPSDYSQPLPIYIRNESSGPITKITAKLTINGKPAETIDIARDCSGRPMTPKAFQEVVFEGRLMQFQVIPFWLFGTTEKGELEEGVYNLVLVLEVEAAS